MNVYVEKQGVKEVLSIVNIVMLNRVYDMRTCRMKMVRLTAQNRKNRKMLLLGI